MQFVSLPVFLALLPLVFASESVPVTTSVTAPVVAPALHLNLNQRYPLEGLLTHEFSVSPPGIVEVEERPEGLVLVGLKPGQTRLTAHTDGKVLNLPITVSAPHAKLAESTNPLKELARIRGLRLTPLNGGSILVEGEIASRETYRKLLRLSAAFPDAIKIQAQTAPGLKASLMEQALAALRSQGLSQVEIGSAGHRYILYGTVSSAIDVEQALEVVRPILPTVENRLPVPISVEPTISVRVYLLELTRRAHRELGLSWSQGVSPLARLAPGGSTFTTAWDVTLRSLAASGQARILAEPLLAVKLGSEAELSAGGEIPIRLTEKFENRLIWRHYGLKLKIKIGGISGRRIRTKVETESSQLDAATEVGGIPGIRSNRLSTEIDAIEKQAVLLTGLFQSRSSKDVEKLPVLGDLPLIGELFKSRDYRNYESELLVALVPEFEAVSTRLPLQSSHGLAIDTNWRLDD